VSLEISALRIACAVWTSPRNHRRGGLLRIAGEYRHGSSGREDALFIRWKLREFRDVQRIDGLVVDCTELAYGWGDDLDVTPHQALDEPPMPLLVAARATQHDALRHAVGACRLRTSLDAALAEMAETIRAMRSLL
jgi:hypothetical protein